MNTEHSINLAEPLKRSSILKCVMLTTWLVMAIGVMLLFEKHEALPNQLGGRPASATQPLPFLSPAHTSLVMFAHPQCPCTSASLNQLNRLMLYSGKADIWVVFLKPSSEPNEWVHSALWKEAQKLEGVHVLEDLDGKLCRCAGAYTSGLVLLYDTKGSELFRGGLTTSRGHEDDSPGLEILESYFKTGKLAAASAPVFGCTLVTKTSTGASI